MLGKKENEHSEQRKGIENVTGNLGNGKAMLVKLFLFAVEKRIFVEVCT